MSKKFNPGFKSKLKGPDLNKYNSLINLCDGVDPNEIDLLDVSQDMLLIPDINILHIAHYFVNSTNSTNMRQLCKYKGTEGYQFFVAGFVMWTGFFKTSSGKIICLGKVKHSQTLGRNVQPLRPWVLLKLNGDVLCGWCDCVAGCGQACSHLGALLYALEYASSKKASLPCTSKPNLWLPPSFRDVPSAQVKDIDFTSASKKRKQLLEEEPDAVNSVVTTQREAIPNDHLNSMLEKLHCAGQEVALFRVLPQYVDEYARKKEDLPLNLSELFDIEHSKKSLTELRQDAMIAFLKVSITEEQRRNTEKLTRKQADSHLWRSMKAGRLSGSNIFSCVHTSVENPSITVIKDVCYPFRNSFVSYWMKRGKLLESKIRDSYFSSQRDKHGELFVRDSGFWISLDSPFIGASPDGFVKCKCCLVGLLEIKAPKLSYVQKYGDINFIPPKHMYQMQLQLYCVGKEATYCDYIVYHPSYPGGLNIQRVYVDLSIQQFIVNQGEVVFTKVILPELLGRYFSSLRNDFATAPELFTVPENPESVDVVCFCQNAREEPMLQCLGPNCTFEWFHAKCFGMKRLPKGGRFLCFQCRASN